MNTTLPCVRGCGTRHTGGIYLCLGVGGTLTVEDLILDPAREWLGGWQRGFKLFEVNGIYHVAIFVGEGFYKSLWDFVEETRRFGVSRRVAPTFPIDMLTPGRSRMYMIHRKAIPMFEPLDSDLEVEAPLPNCKLDWGRKSYKNVAPGWHPKVEKRTMCTFAHKHYAGILHNVDCDDQGNFEIKHLDYSYKGVMPMVRVDDNTNPIKLKWDLGAFMSVPISHIEMPRKLNQEFTQRANRAGWEVAKTEW